MPQLLELHWFFRNDKFSESQFSKKQRCIQLHCAKWSNGKGKIISPCNNPVGASLNFVCSLDVAADSFFQLLIIEHTAGCHRRRSAHSQLYSQPKPTKNQNTICSNVTFLVFASKCWSQVARAAVFLLLLLPSWECRSCMYSSRVQTEDCSNKK